MEANLVILDRNATSFVISGLRKHTTYTVTMTAVSSHGDIQTRVEVTTKEDGMLWWNFSGNFSENIEYYKNHDLHETLKDGNLLP